MRILVLVLTLVIISTIFTKNKKNNNNIKSNDSDYLHMQTHNNSEYLIDKYLKLMRAMNGVALQIKTGEPPIIDNTIKINVTPFFNEEMEMLIMPILSEVQKNELNSKNEIKFIYKNGYNKYNVCIHKYSDSYNAEFVLLKE